MTKEQAEAKTQKKEKKQRMHYSQQAFFFLFRVIIGYYRPMKLYHEKLFAVQNIKILTYETFIWVYFNTFFLKYNNLTIFY